MKPGKFKNRGSIKKIFLSLFLCAAMLFGVFGTSLGTYDANAATDPAGVERIPDSYYADGTMSGNKFNLSNKTYSSYKAAGGATVVSDTGTDSSGNTVRQLILSTPSGYEKGFTYTNFLDIYFTNVGTINGRKVNAQLHYNSLTVSAPYGSVTGFSGWICVAYFANTIFEVHSQTSGRGVDYFGIETGYRAAATYDITVTFTYADTGAAVDLPMQVCLSDIDAGTSTTYTEGWEAVSGFNKDKLFVYTSNINNISKTTAGYKVQSTYSTTSGSDSWLKTGAYAPTTSGSFRCKFYEGNCATALQVYCPYPYIDPPEKTTNAPAYSVGDTVQWSVSEDVLSFYKDTITFYTKMSFYDTLPEGVDYVSAKMYHNGKDVTASYGTLSYDQNTRKVTYTLKSTVLNDTAFYDGGTLRLAIDTVVNEDAGNKISNTAFVNVSGVDYESDPATISVTGIGYVKKADAQTDKPVAGAVYYVYTDKACTTLAKDVNGKTTYFTTTAEAPYSNGITYVPGTYFVKEHSVPYGYLLDDTVYTLVITADSTSYVNNNWVYDDPYGWLKINKISGNEDLTEGNGCYSLEGAKYGVYKSATDAKNDTNRVETLTTDADGNTNEVMIEPGTWYVKEVTASKGFKLCDETLDCTDGTKDGIHKIEVTSDNTEDNPAVIKCVEPPANDPFSLSLQKMDYENGEAVQGTASFEGAIFAVEYYTNTDGKTDGTPYKTWYFMTDEEGYSDCRDETFLADDTLDDSLSIYTMIDGTVLTSDALYKDSDGNVAYPVGTYSIREISPPMYYKNVGYMHFKEDSTGELDVKTGLTAVIKQDENGGAAYIYDGDNVMEGHMDAANLSIHVYDEVCDDGSITIYKEKSDGSKTPLPGVTFKLVGLEEGDEYTATTDEKGKIVWDSLIPQNYVITEIKTVDGYNLLKDNIEVTLPIEMSLDEVNENGADITQAVYDEAAGKYCFYNVILTVGNGVMFDVPFTGSKQNMLYFILIAGIAIVMVGIGTGFRKGSPKF